jgi:hypothetical protein
VLFNAYEHISVTGHFSSKSTAVKLEYSSNKHFSDEIQIDCTGKHVAQTATTKCLDLTIDGALSCKHHTNHRAAKLNSARFAVRAVESLLSKVALKVLYMSYIHPVVACGIMLWGNSPCNIKISKIRKKIIRIITNLGNRDPCRDVFTALKILPFYSQHIFSLLIYTANNRHLCVTNQDIHNINTRSNLNLHIPNSNLTKFHKEYII